MALNITKGKSKGATRATIYGVEGIGKSTLATQIPDCLVIDTEDGTGQIDCARTLALDWRAIEFAFKELIADTQGFRAVVVDTADWLEKALIEHMLKQSGKKSIEDYGFGKGYTILQENVTRFLALADQLVAKGVHVVFVAHAKVVRTSPPDQTDGFDRYELKLTKQVAPLFKEWSDLVLFCNYKIAIVEGTDGRVKAQGGKERVMHTTHSAAWDAKNRFGLAPEMPMEFAQIAHLFGAAAPRAVKEAVKVEPQPERKAEKQPAPLAQPEPVPTTLASAEQIKAIEEIRQTNPALIEAHMEPLNLVEIGEFTEEQAAALIEAAKLNQFPPNVREWLEANADAANAYLRHVQWITVAQDWRALTGERAASLVDRFTKFQTAVAAHAKK
jgi:chemotaxis regulatin CheY-phosphate phosphatase CheZ